MNAKTESTALVVPEALNKAAFDLVNVCRAEAGAIGSRFLALAAACMKHADGAIDKAGSYFSGACAYAEAELKKQWRAEAGLDKDGKPIKAPQIRMMVPSWDVYKSNLHRLFEEGRDPTIYKSMGQVALALKAIKADERAVRVQAGGSARDQVRITANVIEELQVVLAAISKAASALTDAGQKQAAELLATFLPALEYLNTSKNTDALPTINVVIPARTEEQQVDAKKAAAKIARMRGGSK